MSWNTLGAVKPKSVTQAALQLHYAAQWLGRFGRGLTPPKEDDSHTSFVWRAEWQAFVTDSATSTHGLVAMGLRPSTLTLFFSVNDIITESFALHQKSQIEIGNWASHVLTNFDFDLTGFNADAPYTMPSSKFDNGAAFDANGSIAALAEISRTYDNAQPVLEALKQHYHTIAPGPSEVRTWPHHFDSGLLITLEDAPFESARAVGIGLAVPDTLYDEFYFYTYPWPRHVRKNLPSLKSNGRYHKDGFFGAVLPMSKLIGQKNQKANVEAFFAESVQIWINLLKREMAEENK